MLGKERLCPKTASPKRSIWRRISEDAFRRRVIKLKWKSNEVPALPSVHCLREWERDHPRQCNGSRKLDLAIEQRLADDIAFVAAATEGAKLVSAVGIEEFTNHSGLVVRLAVNDTMPQDVADELRKVFDLLEKCASRRLSRNRCSESIFATVKRLCEGRIHARLQSKYWKRPSHLRGKSREPLYENLGKLIPRLRQANLSRAAQNGNMENIWAWLDDLCTTYKAIDDCTDEEAKDALLDVAIQKSYEISTMNGRYSNMESTIQAYGFNANEIAQNKNIMQIDKIGRYWGLCHDLPAYTRKHRALFEKMTLECIQSYLPVKSTVFSSSANAAWKPYVECNVHAEIQLLIYYDTHAATETFKPRVIGVSKAACYLCDLFMREHNEFFHTKTHGQLYDQWTIPDLVEYTSQQVDEYRRIIAALQIQIVTQSQNSRRNHFSSNSWISREAYVLSPTASDAGTLESRISVDHRSGSTTPRTSVIASLTHAQDSHAATNPATRALMEYGAPSSTPRPRTPRSAAEPPQQPSYTSPAYIRSPSPSTSFPRSAEQGAQSLISKPPTPGSAAEPRRQSSHPSPANVQYSPPSVQDQATTQADASLQASATPPALTPNIPAAPFQTSLQETIAPPSRSQMPEPGILQPTPPPMLPAARVQSPQSDGPLPSSRSQTPKPGSPIPITSPMLSPTPTQTPPPDTPPRSQLPAPSPEIPTTSPPHPPPPTHPPSPPFYPSSPTPDPIPSAPNSPSSLSLTSSHLPHSTILTPSRPIHVSTVGLSLTFETECPRTSRIKFMKTGTEMNKAAHGRHNVDIDALEPGAAVEFEREDEIVLFLRRGENRGDGVVVKLW